MTIIAITFRCVCAAIIAASVAATSAHAAEPASRLQPTGKLVDLGGHKLHMNCTGKGNPTVVVMTRAEGGYGDDLDVPAAQLEKERKDGQAMLAHLSTNSKQIVVHTGHNMELEAPDEVAAAIRQVVEAVRHHAKL